MESNKKNTFGNYKFDDWVPDEIQKMIIGFWGIFGRDYKEWLKDSKIQGEKELCMHGPEPNGFGMPPYGAKVEYFIRDWEEKGKDRFISMKGKYIHRWNNNGSVIEDNGTIHHVSTVDKWVRIFKNKEEKKLITDKLCN